jgi:glycosyltransferase involved in cell wall biosynthesis
LRSYLARQEPDVLFSAMTFATVVVLATAISIDTDTDLVAVEHDTFGRDRTLKGRLVARTAARLYRTADHVLAVSQGVADSVVERTQVDPSRVTVQHNPVEIERIRRESRASVDHPWLDREHDVVLSVGRIAPQKDHETLIRAFTTVHEAHPEARLIIAGTGPERDDLLALIDSLCLDDVVSLPGHVENAYGYMRRASAFALSSRHEGLPTVLIEALACGCPVVSTDCPSGPREILADGEYGRLVPVGEPERLADALVATLDDPPALGPLRERADDFAASRAVDRYAAFVDARADRSGSGRG